MLSYVAPDGQTEGREFDADNHKYGQEAEKLVARLLSEQGYMVNSIGGNNPGYDIEAVDPNSGEVYFIEVKGVLGNWNSTGVSLSATQFNLCLQKQEHYILYVVECLVGKPVFHKIVNPASLINAYYFDQNWSEVSERTAGEKQTVELDDLFIDEETKSLYYKIVEGGLESPEIGFPVQDSSGEIIAELEFAWPTQKVGIFYDQGESLDGWTTTSVEELCHELDWLFSVLNN
jgi:Holliday junction resolvase-like predicted endonuclease